MKKITLTAIGLALVCAGNAQAGGYQLNEFSTTGLGRAFAGAGIMDDDYSNLANNPAGMVLAKRSGLQVGYTAVEEYSHVKGTNPGESTKMHYPVSLPSTFGQWRVNDKMTLGAGFYVPFGLSTKHKSDSFVSGKAKKSELQVMDTAIAGAYRVTDKLSLGATGIYRYIHGNMTGNVFNPMTGNLAGEANYDLDGWTMTGIIGAMYEFTPETRVGVSYKFKSKQTVKGDYSFEADLTPLPIGPQTFDDGRASPDLPASLIISAYHQLNDKWGLSASARWTQWSVFDTFTMQTPSGHATPGYANAGTFVQHQYDWRDTITYSLGADYKINENWTWRFGGAYDPSPCKSARHRTNRIPDVNRIWAATGFSYQTGNWQLDGGFAHLFMTKGWVHKGYNDVVEAQYASKSNMYSLNLQYKF